MLFTPLFQMGRTYKRKTNKSSWSAADMAKALHEIRGGRPIRKVGKVFNIPESTLRDRLKSGSSETAKLGRNPVFTREQETELANHVILMSNMFFGLTPIELRRLAYEFAEVNQIKNDFNKHSKHAGKDWLGSFIKRTSNISLRKPEATSVNRIGAFNEQEVQQYFSNLEEVLQKYKFSPRNIYNVDESGISTVQRPAKILSPKGQKQVGSVTSWERGKNVTVVCAMSASGRFVPPMFIYPRMRVSPQLKKNGPRDAIYCCSKNGWINEALFFEWLQHFKKDVKPSLEDPVLLILDNHASHISLRIHAFCKDSGIVMVSLPPHCSHRLQPLDLVFFGPLKSVFNRECDRYLKTSSYEKITHYELAELFNRAYVQVASLEKGESGFSAAGVSPFNPNKFSAADFAPAQNFATISLQPEETSHPSTSVETVATENSRPGSGRQEQIGLGQQNSETGIPENAPTHSENPSSVSELSPIPKKIRRNQTLKIANKKQHSEILTSTPMKLRLTVMEEKKNKKSNNNNKKQKIQAKKPTSKRNSKKKHVSKDSSDSDSDSCGDICDDNDVDDIEIAGRPSYDVCSVCGEFGRDKELWYRCVLCSSWAHSECSGWDTAVGYTCDLCIRKEKLKKKL